MLLKKINIISALLFRIISIAQTTIIKSLYNPAGGILMYENAALYIHTHIKNDRTFESNLRFTSFYHNTETLTVYGT